MTQNQQILEHLRKYGSITTIESFRLYGITRLSGRIFELRKTYPIEGMREETNGKIYTRYFLKEGEKQHKKKGD